MIVMRRYETTTVHNVLQGFRTADCDWLAPHTPGALKQARVSVTDALKRRELLEDFVLWYFDGFLIPLLKVRYSRPRPDLTTAIWRRADLGTCMHRRRSM